jgi:hypothetical protein
VGLGSKEEVYPHGRTNDGRHIHKGVKSSFNTIDADRATIGGLKKRVHRPKAGAISERPYAFETSVGRLGRQFGRQRMLQRQINTSFSERYDLISRLHEDDKRYHAKLIEDWSQGVERWNVEREAEEGGKRKARELPPQEEVSQSAFRMQIKDCQMLIDYFSGETRTAIVPSATPGDTQPISAGQQVAAVPGHFVRLKKTDEEEEDYFYWEMSNAPGIDLSLSTLSTLHSLSILPPSSQADVPRVIEDLKAKKARFEMNRARLTAPESSNSRFNRA